VALWLMARLFVHLPIIGRQSGSHVGLPIDTFHRATAADRRHIASGRPPHFSPRGVPVFQGPTS